MSTGLSIEHSVDSQLEAALAELYTHLSLLPHSSSVTDSAIGPTPSLSPQVALATQHVALSAAPAVSHAAPAQLNVALAGLYTWLGPQSVGLSFPSCGRDEGELGWRCYVQHVITV